MTSWRCRDYREIRMGESSVRLHRNTATPRVPPPVDDDGIEELRQLLISAEREHLAAIQARLDDAEARRREVAELLPSAVLQQARDPEFARALAPTVERAITASVRQN